jgi:hypothetical protein
MMHAHETREIEEALRRCRRRPILKQDCGDQVALVFAVTVHLFSFVRTHLSIFVRTLALCDRTPAIAKLRALDCTPGLRIWRHGGCDGWRTLITVMGWAAPLPESACLYELRNRASHKIWRTFCKAP